MPATTAANLRGTLANLNGYNWKDKPGAEVDRAMTSLLALPGLKGEVIAFLAEEHNRVTSFAQASELITRTDVLLHQHPRADIEVWLHYNRMGITVNSAIRPQLNAKGYWQATIVLCGRLTRRDYVYDGPPNEWMFNRNHLRAINYEERRGGQAFVLNPDQIHQLDEIEKGTVTLTINVLRDAKPYRVYLPQMEHFIIEQREPRTSRLLAIAKHLASTT